MRAFATLALVAALTIPAHALDLPSDPVKRISLIMAVGGFVHQNCAFMQPDNPAISKALRANGVSPKQATEEPYRSEARVWVGSFRATTGTGEMCEILDRMFGLDGRILAGLVQRAR